MTTTGHIYIASGDTGLTTFTVSLAPVYHPPSHPVAVQSSSHLAILKAALVQRGFPSVVYRGASLVFVVDNAAARPSIGQAIDAIGQAFGGIAYRFTLSGYQCDAGTGSERLAFEVGPLREPVRGTDLYEANDDMECG